MLLAENAIQDIMTEQTPLPVTVDRIIDEVARTYGVTAEDIRGQRRSNQISTARQVAMYVVREITGMTQLEIGQEFGGRDHSTVVYALQQVTKAIQTDPRKKEVIEDIIKNIRNLNGLYLPTAFPLFTPGFPPRCAKSRIFSHSPQTFRISFHTALSGTSPHQYKPIYPHSTFPHALLRLLIFIFYLHGRKH